MAPKTKNSWLGMLKTFKIIGFHHIWSKKNSIPHMCNFPLSDVLKWVLDTDGIKGNEAPFKFEQVDRYVNFLTHRICQRTNDFYK